MKKHDFGYPVPPACAVGGAIGEIGLWRPGATLPRVPNDVGARCGRSNLEHAFRCPRQLPPFVADFGEGVHDDIRTAGQLECTLAFDGWNAFRQDELDEARWVAVTLGEDTKRWLSTVDLFIEPIASRLRGPLFGEFS